MGQDFLIIAQREGLGLCVKKTKHQHLANRPDQQQAEQADSP